ncbi:MAG: amidase family protein [Verrucomicrobiota bacterium]
MSTGHLNFEAWRDLSEENPERLIDNFLSKYGLLTSETQRAFLATRTPREAGIRNIRAAAAKTGSSLAGVPYLLQDLFDIRGLSTQCGAPFEAPFGAPLESSCLLKEKLENHGAAFLAKLVPSEFGWDMKGHNATYGNCPHSEGRSFVTGGGAGACAYAVSSGWAPLAFGLDSCGGIRIPAAFHGLFGFRMETNVYARDGVFPIIPSIESVGWLNANIDDLLSTFLTFYDAEGPKPETLRGSIHGSSMQMLATETKAGLMELLRPLDIDEDPAANKLLRSIFKNAAKAFKTIESRELYAVHQYWIEEYEAYYDPRLLRRIQAGRSCYATESEEASSNQQNLRAEFVRFFEVHDYLVIPICPLPTPEKTDWDSSLEEEILQLNAPVSLAFLPTLILPFKCGENTHSAAQIVFNPRKPELVPELISRLRDYYVKY